MTDDELLLTTREVAAMFRVSTTQVLRWASKYPRQLGAVRVTPKGPYRFSASKVAAARSEGLQDEEASV